MAINFDSLPQSAPRGTLVDEGVYVATVRDAVMKAPKNPQKPGEMYLNLSFNIEATIQGEEAKGVIFDMLFDRDNQYLRYKLKAFLDALSISFEGDFELQDLLTIVKGKKLLINVGVDTQGQQDRNTIKLFDDNDLKPYHKFTELASLAGATGAISAEDSIDGEEDY